MADEKGYFAVLGLTFRAEDNEIGKKYKRLALKMHPDKNPGQEAVDAFQKITTAYHVIMDEAKRKNYLRLFLLRCYMSQSVPAPDGPLRPFYAFMVEKAKSKHASKSERLITFDLLEWRMNTFKKDKDKKEFPLTALKGVEVNEGATGAKALELVITFKESHSYYVRCRCQEHFDTMVIVLRRITGAEELTDEALNVLCDDSSSPPASVHKSKVIKRAEKFGGALAHDWQPRFMVMGHTNLVIFRDVELAQMVNIIPLQLLKLAPDAKDPTCFQLATFFWKASFRVLTADVAAQWKTSLEALTATDSEGGPAPVKRMASRPSVAYSQADVAAMRTGNVATPRPPGMPPPIAEMEAIDLSDQWVPPAERSSASKAELEPADDELPGGWLQYSTDDGHKYYYCAATGETRWTPPTAAAAPKLEASASFREAAEPLASKPDTDAVKQAQMAELKEDKSRDPGAVAEAKAAMISLMQSMERGLSKTRRGVEADRPLKDLAPMFEQLRQNFEKLTKIGADFEQKSMVRDEHINNFMAGRSAQLNSLQAHLLGEQSPSNSVASKIFKKSAYVAESFQPGQVGVVRNLV